MRLIKQGGWYKIQRQGFFGGWNTWQYEDVGWYGEGSLEDWKFETIDKAKEFICSWYDKPVKVICYVWVKK